MKKYFGILSLAAAVACGTFETSAFAQGQPAAGAAKAPDIPAKIGLVDMAKVFKKYEKFEHLRNDLQAEMGQMQAEAKTIKGQVDAIQQEMKEYNKDSKEYKSLQEKMVRMTTGFEAKAKLSAPEFARREAQIFEEVYLDATNIVKLYAEFYKYTLVLRFNSDQIDADTPQQLANGLNKLVLYHRTQDDITDVVIEALNKKYRKETGVATGGNPGVAPKGSANPPKVAGNGDRPKQN